jgi:polysaccharide biosynthesis transport protein
MNEPILTQIWRACFRRIWPAAFAAIFVMTASVVIIMTLPDIYRASTTIEFHTSEGVAESSDGTAESIEAHMFSLTNYVLGRESLSEIIEHFDLYPDLRKSEPRNVVVETMRRDIAIEPRHVDGGWGRRVMVAFELSFRGVERDTVEQVVSRLANVFIQENSRLYDQKIVENLSSLEIQIEVAKERMENIEGKLQAYREQNTGRLPEQLAVNLSTLERLNSDLRIARENMMRAMDRRDELYDRRFEAVDENASDERTRLARLKNELVTLNRRVSEDHPTVRRLRAEISAIENSLVDSGEGNGVETLRETQVDRLDSHMTALLDEERRIVADINYYEARIEELPRVEHELTAMKRQYDSARDQYTALLDRYQRSRLGEIHSQNSGPQLRMMDVPLTPRTPEEPQRIRLVLMAFMLSLLLAGGIVALLEQLDGSFHTLSELQSYTKVPVAAIIPGIVIEPSLVSRVFRYLLIFAAVCTFVAVLLFFGIKMHTDGDQSASAVSVGAFYT